LIATDWQSTLVWASGTLIASWSYSRFLRRRTALVSNLLAGGLVALVPLSGVSFIGDAKSWVLSAGIFFLMFGRELQKDALDSEGDTRYRPPSILLRNPNGIFRLVYPLILIMSGVLLYSAVLSDHFWANLGALTIAALHGLALIAFLHNREGHQMQANITKVASYWLVIVLLI
jgi:4-hydroxybenzoate polyprenyltransferase